MYGAHSKFDNGTTSTEYRRSRKGYCLASGWQYAKKCCCETWCQSGCLWQRFQATNSVRNRPRSGRPRSTTNREDRYITNMALRQRTTTARRLRDNLRTATGEPIIYAAVARLFDHHSYHVTERPDVIGARFICGGNVFSGVE